MGKTSSNIDEAIAAEKLKQEQEKTKQIAADREKAEALAKQEQEKAKQEQEKTKQFTEETAAKTKILAEETIKAKGIATQAVNAAEQIAIVTKNKRRLGWFGVGIVALLGADYFWNGNEWVIHQRIKYKLTRQSTSNLKPIPSVTIPRRQTPLIPMFKPTLLLGESGTGKSTLFAMLARKCIEDKVPNIYISVRGNTNKQVPNVEKLHSVERLNVMANQVLQEIGYPTRDPFITTFVKSIRAIRFGTATIESEAKPESLTVSRFQVAFNSLFKVCKEIRDERKAKGFSDLEAAPVILMDEVHDLMKDSKLANVGGREMFETLTTQLVVEGVTNNCIRSVIAGSDGQLAFDANYTHMKSNRLIRYYLQDPNESDVKVALKAKGYTEEECNQVISFCGTRLRILEDILLPENKVEIANFLRATKDIAVTDYKTFFKTIENEGDKQMVVKILDTIYEGKMNVDIEELPEPVQQGEYTTVFYLTPDSRLHFQSQSMRNTWPHYKTEHLQKKQLK